MKTLPPVPYTRYKRAILALNTVYANWCELLEENADLKKQLKERTVKPKFKKCACGLRWILAKSTRCLSCEMKRRYCDPAWRAKSRAACQAGIANAASIRTTEPGSEVARGNTNQVLRRSRGAISTRRPPEAA